MVINDERLNEGQSLGIAFLFFYGVFQLKEEPIKRYLIVSLDELVAEKSVKVFLGITAFVRINRSFTNDRRALT